MGSARATPARSIGGDRRELADHKEQPNETGLSQQLAAGQQTLLLVSEKVEL